MKKYFATLKKVLLLMVAVFPMALFAQEKVKVMVKVIEDGKTLTDTVYTYASTEEAEKALQLMDVLNKEDLHINFKEESCEHKKVIVVNNGEKAGLDEGMQKPDTIKAKTIKVIASDDPDKKVKVIMIKDGDESEKYDIMLLDGEDLGTGEKEYQIKVITGDGDEEMEWTEGDAEGKIVEKKVIIIKEDECCEKGKAAEQEMKAKQQEQEVKAKQQELKAQEMKAQEEAAKKAELEKAQKDKKKSK